MKTAAIIPARMDSSRFPGKPMKEIHGMPMIGHIFERSKFISNADIICVATCDQEIFDYINASGGFAVMTSDKHERATERTAEALTLIEKNMNLKINLVAMIQGDEPMTTTRMISQALSPFSKDNSINVVNLMSDIEFDVEFQDPNEVKVVINKNNDAIYFSREPIPSKQKGETDGPMRKQVCVIPFRRNFLLKFNEMDETILEKIESVDMLRAIENGYKVRMIYSEDASFSVDTKEDLDNVIIKMKDDPLMKSYI